MSNLESLKSTVRSMADQSRGCSQFLLSECQQIATMTNQLMQVIQGSNDPNYKETLSAMSQAIKAMQEAAQYLEAAATTGENWASEQKVLSKKR